MPGRLSDFWGDRMRSTHFSLGPVRAGLDLSSKRFFSDVDGDDDGFVDLAF